MTPKNTMKELFSFVPVMRGLVLLLCAALAYSYLGGRYTARQESAISANSSRVTEIDISLEKLVDTNTVAHDNISKSIHGMSVNIAEIQTDLKWLIRSQPNAAYKLTELTEGATP